MDLFSIEGQDYILELRGKEKTISSGLRNLLIRLKIVVLSHNKKTLVLSQEYTPVFLNNSVHKMVTEEQFEEILRKQKNIGTEAEKRILEYERKRLGKWPEFLDDILHVAKNDVGAGYDILSYDVIKNGRIPRFIEVKAVSNIDHKFYWTKNEMKQSKIHKSSYFLYLLPVKSSNSFEIENLQIIQNPYQALLSKNSKWKSEVELISIFSKE